MVLGVLKVIEQRFVDTNTGNYHVSGYVAKTKGFERRGAFLIVSLSWVCFNYWNMYLIVCLAKLGVLIGMIE